MKTATGTYCHRMRGMSWYHANGFASHTAISQASMSVAAFHRLNSTKPLINAAKVGARKVSMPTDVAGLTKGTSHPKMNPEIIPYKGPSNGAERLERRTLENVIDAGVPGTGYMVRRDVDRRSAVQMVMSAMYMVFILVLPFVG